MGTQRIKERLRPEHLVRVFVDVLIIMVSMAGALWVRMDFRFNDIDPAFLYSMGKYMAINIICTVALFRFFRLYSSLWRFAGITEMKNIVLATLSSTALQTAGLYALGWRMPRSYPLLYLFLLFILTGFSRYVWRLRPGGGNKPETENGELVHTMIVGAGEAGNLLLKELLGSRNVNREIVCIVDDDPAKTGTYLHGVPILGRTNDIPLLTERYHVEEIIIAMPSVSGEKKRQIMELCTKENDCRVLTLPGIYQIVNGDVHVSMLRKIEINDLLGREPVDLRTEKVMHYVQGKTVLITGGGGSIGSEICRQVAMHDPKCMVILDIYENNAYDIQLELRRRFPQLRLEVLIGSVRDRKRVDTIYETFRPNLVFHAAAHKHVPLMEDSPNEAIKNNVLGTWNVARAADVWHAEKMVLISTDKAVRPTNIMGASKRICELIVQSFNQTSATEYAAVRFGNVLGSNGSVVPLFQKQIAQGGPVTVTHPEVIRYFMTIPEAVNLVLQCGALASGGEIFILDMGEPVKILDLAKNMIRLSGLEPEKDIQITFTGLRPGEKLYEELLISLDNLKKTENEQIFIAQPASVDVQWVHSFVQKLVEDAFAETDRMREEVRQLVPEYTPKSNRTDGPREPEPERTPTPLRKENASLSAAH